MLPPGDEEILLAKQYRRPATRYTNTQALHWADSWTPDTGISLHRCHADAGAARKHKQNSVFKTCRPTHEISTRADRLSTQRHSATLQRAIQSQSDLPQCSLSEQLAGGRHVRVHSFNQ